VTFQEFLVSRDTRIEYWQMKKELFYELKNAKPMIFINRTETPYDQLATVIFREIAGQVLSDITEGIT
jgi:hypothetical protein